MNSLLHEGARAKRLLCKVAGLLLLLCSPCADGGVAKGLYVGGDFYAPGESTQNAARASGFTRLFLSFVHVDERGDLTYNNIPVVRNGIYVGDLSWETELAELRKQPTSIDRIELAVGGGSEVGGAGEDASFANIRDLIASQGTGPGSILYRDFLALKDATGVDAIQFVDERTCDVSSAAALGRIVAALGMKVSFCAHTHQDFWASLKSELGANADAIYLPSYTDLSNNDPSPWTRVFGGSAVYPGLWGNTDTATSAMMKMRNWRQTLGVAGGFIWLNGFMPEDAGRWAEALSYGLDPIASLRVVNRNSGKSLNLIGGGLTNSALISQSGYEAGNEQRWMLVPTKNGAHFKIVSWVSGKCASIAYDSCMVGAQLWTWAYNNDPSQEFDLIDAGSGWFEIKNVRSGLVLEVAGGSTTENAAVQQNIETGSINQMWKLLPYEASLLAFENFDYPVGALGGQNGGEGWHGSWSDVVNSGAEVSAGSLVGGANVPVGYDARSSGNAAFVPNDKRVGRYLDCSVSGNFGVYGYLDANGRIGAGGKTLYISFLEQPSKTSLFYEFELNRGIERIAGIGNDTPTDDVSLRAPADTFTPIAPGNTNVNFYVMRIDFKPGSDDVRVYCNPTSGTEPGQPTLELRDAADMSFDRITLAAFANDNTVEFDQIRIASSWEHAVAAAPEFAIQPSSNIVADDIFRRVRISAQVLCGTKDKYYLMDGNTGLHVVLSQSVPLEAGDIAAVTGLVERKAPLVSLIEAEARKTGHLPLPPPQPLNLLDPGKSPLWVSVEGVLTGLKDNGVEQTLEMQIGPRRLVARFRPTSKVSANWSLGSRLKLTGVCLRHLRGVADREKEDALELLLNSSAAVEVIARPPWLTVKRAMFAIGVLMAGLALAFVWIWALQAQVERQTIRLRSEITQREQAERARAIEEERSRISRDLHDDLGSILTQINMLANFTPGGKSSLELLRERMRQISEKSHRMISALDQVVWMMNSRDESLSSLASYLAAYAEEFLSKTSIVCRIEAPTSYPERAVTADVRNNVFSSVKEAINNSVRHGKPGKLCLKLCVLEQSFEIQIHDDGCGFDPLNVEQGNGLANLQRRMQKVGGTCQIQSSPGDGTTVSLQLPLAPLTWR
jgi:signal transduction histidine kinase